MSKIPVDRKFHFFFTVALLINSIALLISNCCTYIHEILVSQSVAVLNYNIIINKLTVYSFFLFVFCLFVFFQVFTDILSKKKTSAFTVYFGFLVYPMAVSMH